MLVCWRVGQAIAASLPHAFLLPDGQQGRLKSQPPSPRQSDLQRAAALIATDSGAEP